MTFKLTDRQIEVRDVLAGAARHVLVYGGSRSGKTFLLNYATAARAIQAVESRHVIARLHNIDVRQSVMMDTFPKVMKLAFPGVEYKENKSDQFVTLANGSEIWFAGLDDKDRIDKILGKEFATIYVNEASQVSYEAVLTLRTRLAQKCLKADGTPLRLKGYYDLNPTGKGHWSFLEFVKGVRPDNPELLLPEGVRQWCAMNPSDNPNLPEEYLEELASLPERQRKRFLEGQYLSEVPGALWPAESIEPFRRSKDRMPELGRIIVGVDPSGSDGAGGDRQGIVVAGMGADGRFYILEDCSCRKDPDGWAKVVCGAYQRWEADLIVAEANFGGAMVENTIRTADKHLPVKLVTASRGKHIRAEPIAALYSQGKVSHIGTFSRLEEQMAMITTSGYQGGDSPDCLDAMVWAMSELALGVTKGAAIAELYRRDANTPKSVAEKLHKPEYAIGSVEYQRALLEDVRHAS